MKHKRKTVQIANRRSWSIFKNHRNAFLFVLVFGLIGSVMSFFSYALTSPSGQGMPRGDISGWRQVFTDDFNDELAIGSFSGCTTGSGGFATHHCSGLPSAVDARWWAYPDNWKDTSKNGTYYPSKVISQHDGVMDLYLHTEDGKIMVAAPVPKIPGATGNGGGLSAGRYAIRFKADPIYCYKTAWLLWPDSETWPRDGEIDFPEGNLNGTINAFMHRQNGTSGNDQDAYSTTATYTSWHTAVIEWNTNSLKFYLDEQLIGHSTNRVPNTPMHWVIQTETALSGCVPSSSDVGHVLIDWVAVYVPQTSVPSSTPTPSPSTSATTSSSSTQSTSVSPSSTNTASPSSGAVSTQTPSSATSGIPPKDDAQSNNATLTTTQSKSTSPKFQWPKGWVLFLGLGSILIISGFAIGIWLKQKLF